MGAQRKLIQGARRSGSPLTEPQYCKIIPLIRSCFVFAHHSKTRVLHILGMVYMSSSGLDWNPILQGWLNNRPPSESTVIMDLFERSFPELYRFSIQNLTFKMDVLEAFIIRQVYYSFLVFKVTNRPL